jgi:hypothetical protein
VLSAARAPETPQSDGNVIIHNIRHNAALSKFPEPEGPLEVKMNPNLQPVKPIDRREYFVSPANEIFLSDAIRACEEDEETEEASLQAVLQ